MLPLIAAFLFCASSILIIGIQNPWGWIGIFIALGLSFKSHRSFQLHLGFLSFCLAVLSATEISTDLSEKHIIFMGVPLTSLIILAYFLSKKTPHFKAINFELKPQIFKTKSAHIYLIIANLIGLFLIPFYLWHSQAYLNWNFPLESYEVFKLFLGTNFLGLWDELFFINICFVLFRQHFSLLKANLFQALLFTSFLFELGFTGWGPLIIFPFALIQGYTYEKTKSLSFVVAIHLALDFILFISLVYLNHFLP